MDLEYENLSDSVRKYPEKFPHQRLVFKDQDAKHIAIKIVCLTIRFSGAFNNTDRPRLTEYFKLILEKLMQVQEFNSLYKSCSYGLIENLTHAQVDLIMS